MNIDDAARATRWYWISGSTSCDGWIIMDDVRRLPGGREYATSEEAQAACDRMNLRAVLDAIRGFGGPFAPDYEMVIDAIIEEVGK